MVRFLLAVFVTLLFCNTAQATDGHKLDALHRAAKKGVAEAQLELASHYMMGQGVVQNPKTARNWYEKAADQGHPRAQTMLGLLYINGMGVKAKGKARFDTRELGTFDGFLTIADGFKIQASIAGSYSRSKVNSTRSGKIA